MRASHARPLLDSSIPEAPKETEADHAHSTVTNASIFADDRGRNRVYWSSKPPRARRGRLTDQGTCWEVIVLHNMRARQEAHTLRIMLPRRKRDMRRYRAKVDRWTWLVIPLLLLGGGATVAALPGPPREALTAEEAIACIRTAVAAQAGWVHDVEGEDERGFRLCEVTIVDATGKRHTLPSDVETQQVLKTT
jgi:hypothetical protein